MYLPQHFRETRLEVMHDLIRAHPFATVVSIAGGRLAANHLPLVLHSESGECGTLQGHMARANPLWQDADPTLEILAIFQGVNTYITPSWYPSKKEHGKVVPTWNYAIVHAHGVPRFIEDTDWLRTHLNELTSRHESERPVPWAASDAPDDYIEKQMKGIVGIELPIARIEGKWKVSQNRNDPDRRGVSRGLRLESGGHPSPMAELVDRTNQDR